MAYAALDDVLARAGRLAGLFVEGKRPTPEDVTAFLEQVSAEIDTQLVSRGYDPETMPEGVDMVLLDVAAWATLARALPQASLDDEAVAKLLERADSILNDYGFPGLSSGSSSNVFATLESLEPGTSTTTIHAGSFWDDLPDCGPRHTRYRDDVTFTSEYGLPAGFDGEGCDDGPYWRRGMAL